MHRNFSLHMWQAAGGWAVLLSHMRVEDFSPLCTPTKRALSLPNDPLTMLREIIALWAIWTLLCPFLRLTVTWLKIFLDVMIDETFSVRLIVISQSKARFDQCKITKTSSRSSEAVSHKTSLLSHVCHHNKRAWLTTVKKRLMCVSKTKGLDWQLSIFCQSCFFKLHPPCKRFPSTGESFFFL